MPGPFPSPGGKAELEEGGVFTPRFDADGLIGCITLDAHDGAVLMFAHMNAEALRLTLETGVAHYWSRSRQSLWRKGDTSGQQQRVVEISTDCDQDVLLMKVVPAGDGGACHTGRRSCFYRKLTLGTGATKLTFDAPDAGKA
ncbi:MAG: phosphoribosyl-AMP cyclohydrolase [Methylovirgula sp.]